MAAQTTGFFDTKDPWSLTRSKRQQPVQPVSSTLAPLHKNPPQVPGQNPGDPVLCASQSIKLPMNFSSGARPPFACPAAVEVRTNRILKGKSPGWWDPLGTGAVRQLQLRDGPEARTKTAREEGLETY